MVLYRSENFQTSKYEVRKASYFKNNHKIIFENIQSDVILWVSDLMWPQNNIVYHELLRDKLIQVNYLMKEW